MEKIRTRIPLWKSHRYILLWGKSSYVQIVCPLLPLLARCSEVKKPHTAWNTIFHSPHKQKSNISNKMIDIFDISEQWPPYLHQPSVFNVISSQKPTSWMSTHRMSFFYKRQPVSMQRSSTWPFFYNLIRVRVGYGALTICNDCVLKYLPRGATKSATGVLNITGRYQARVSFQLGYSVNCHRIRGDR